MNDAWLWPKHEISPSSVTQSNHLLKDIEAFFSELYAPFPVVYFARARIGLTAALAVHGASRPDLTFCQPFSSHCVLSAISEVSTPTTIDASHSARQVIYHQWGHKTLATHTNGYHNPVIEDAVDSLILTNGKDELFPNDAPFCIISLPKIINAAIGAIVVCQSLEDQLKLLAYREQQESERIDIACLTKPYLQESIFKASPSLVPNITDISENFWQSVTRVSNNIAKIGGLFSSNEQLNIIGLDKATTGAQRLPANLILSVTDEQALHYYQRSPFQVLEKVRTYFDYQENQCRKVSLLPCHYQAHW